MGAHRCRIPKSNLPIGAGACQELAGRGEGDPAHSFGVLYGTERLAARYLPQPKLFIVSPGSQHLALWIKSGAEDHTSVPLQRAQAVSGLGVPQPDRSVPRGRYQHPPVWRPRDASHPRFVTTQGAHKLYACRQAIEKFAAHVSLATPPKPIRNGSSAPSTLPRITLSSSRNS